MAPFEQVMAAPSEVIEVFLDAKEDGELLLWLYNVPDELREQIRAGESASRYFVSRAEGTDPKTVHVIAFSPDAYTGILDGIVERGYRIAAAQGFVPMDHPGFHRKD
jgi:hypothetical protein